MQNDIVHNELIPKLCNEIDFSNIRLGKIFKYGDNHHMINIYNMLETAEIATLEKGRKRQESSDEASKLAIQTPLLHIPYGIVYFNKNNSDDKGIISSQSDKPYLYMAFTNSQHDNTVSEFETWLLNLENHIYGLLKLKRSLNIASHVKIPILKRAKFASKTYNHNHNNQSSEISHLYLPINLSVSKCIVSVTGAKDKIAFDWKLATPTYGVCIIWIKNVWIKNGKWGINLFTYACKVMDSHLLDPNYIMNNPNYNNKNIMASDINKYFTDGCIPTLQTSQQTTQNASHSNIETIGLHPEYGKFYKMLKMGVPRDAVKHKLITVGIDPLILEFPENTPSIFVIHSITNGGPELLKSLEYSKQKYSKSSHTHMPLQTSQIPPPPPPLNALNVLNAFNESSNSKIVMDKQNNNIHGAIFKSILAGEFKLKKVSDINNNDNKQDNSVNSINSINSINNNPNGLKVPSLQDITTALAKLKKVNIN